MATHMPHDGDAVGGAVDVLAMISKAEAAERHIEVARLKLRCKRMRRARLGRMGMGLLRWGQWG